MAYYYTYILHSPDFNQLYYGQTCDLALRLSKHNTGQVKSTKRYLPWILFTYKKFTSRAEAVLMERKLKNLRSRERLFTYIKHNKFIINNLILGCS